MGNLWELAVEWRLLVESHSPKMAKLIVEPFFWIFKNIFFGVPNRHTKNLNHFLGPSVEAFCSS